jgi:hypothetical protein
MSLNSNNIDMSEECKTVVAVDNNVSANQIDLHLKAFKQTCKKYSQFAYNHILRMDGEGTEFLYIKSSLVYEILYQLPGWDMTIDKLIQRAYANTENIRENGNKKMDWFTGRYAYSQRDMAAQSGKNMEPIIRKILEEEWKYDFPTGIKIIDGAFTTRDNVRLCAEIDGLALDKNGETAIFEIKTCNFRPLTRNRSLTRRNKIDWQAQTQLLVMKEADYVIEVDVEVYFQTLEQFTQESTDTIFTQYGDDYKDAKIKDGYLWKYFIVQYKDGMTGTTQQRDLGYLHDDGFGYGFVHNKMDFDIIYNPEDLKDTGSFICVILKDFEFAKHYRDQEKQDTLYWMFEKNGYLTKKIEHDFLGFRSHSKDYD